MNHQQCQDVSQDISASVSLSELEREPSWGGTAEFGTILKRILLLFFLISFSASHLINRVSREAAV